MQLSNVDYARVQKFGDGLKIFVDEDADRRNFFRQGTAKFFGNFGRDVTFTFRREDKTDIIGKNFVDRINVVERPQSAEFNSCHEKFLSMRFGAVITSD